MVLNGPPIFLVKDDSICIEVIELVELPRKKEDVLSQF